jgi:hypothetical protein
LKPRALAEEEARRLACLPVGYRRYHSGQQVSGEEWRWSGNGIGVVPEGEHLLEVDAVAEFASGEAAFVNDAADALDVFRRNESELESAALDVGWCASRVSACASPGANGEAAAKKIKIR